MTTSATTMESAVTADGRASWPRTAGTLIVTGGVLLTAATALEIGTDVATSPVAAAAFWALFLTSTLAHVAAMFPLALGRGDGRGAVASSTLGKVALLGFGAFFLANQSIYLITAYLWPDVEPVAGLAPFLVAMSAVQGALLLIGGIVIARAGVLRGAARGAILALALVGFALGVTVNASSVEAVTDTMYFFSTGAQIVAGILIARATVTAAE